VKVSNTGLKIKYILGEVIRAQNDRPTERQTDADVAFTFMNFHFIKKKS